MPVFFCLASSWFSTHTLKATIATIILWWCYHFFRVFVTSRCHRTEKGYSDFVCTCLQTQSMTELNQKLTKSIPRSLLRGIYTKEIEGGGRLLKGGIFSVAYGNSLWALGCTCSRVVDASFFLSCIILVLNSHANNNNNNNHSVVFSFRYLWHHGVTVSHAKSSQAFLSIFLQSCKTKSGTEGFGSRLYLHG